MIHWSIAAQYFTEESLALLLHRFIAEIKNYLRYPQLVIQHDQIIPTFSTLGSAEDQVQDSTLLT
jgi:hypothetical protein